MKVAVLGATGFVGAHLVRYFHQKGYDVYGFGRTKIVSHIDNYCIYQTFQELPNHIGNFDIVINCIAGVSYGKTNEKGLNEYIISLLTRITTNHIIHISSSSVYMGLQGNLSEGITIEETALMNEYAIEKLRLEKMILGLNVDKITILRPRAIYGKNDRVLLYSLLSSTINKRIPFFGKDNIQTSLTHVMLLCDFCNFISKNPHKAKEIYNIADHRTYKLIDVISIINTLFFSTLPLRLPFGILYLLRLIDYNKYLGLKDIFTKNTVLDTSKIEALGYQNTSNFFDEIGEIAIWWKNEIRTVKRMQQLLPFIPWI